MTPHNLFNIILKIFGLFFIKTMLTCIPQLLLDFTYLNDLKTFNNGLWILLINIFIFMTYAVVFYFLVFKTEYLIDKLQLTKGFNENSIALNIHPSTILSISITIIGGLLIVDEFPNCCRQLLAYFKVAHMSNRAPDPELSYIIVSGIKIGIGILLVLYRKMLVRLIEPRDK